MRIFIVLALALAGCPAKKPAARPSSVENKQSDLDKDKSERNDADRDDKDDHDAKRGGDPCEGGE